MCSFSARSNPSGVSVGKMLRMNLSARFFCWEWLSFSGVVKCMFCSLSSGVSVDRNSSLKS